MYFKLFFIGFFFVSPIVSNAQVSDTTTTFTLQQCINYGLQNQPNFKQAQINESITKATNAINKSGLYPQASASADLTHYLQLPGNLTTTNGTTTQSSRRNTSTGGLSVTQNIYNPQLVYYSRVAPYYTKQAQELTDSTKINIYVSVSKSFYNLLLTLQQINILKEDTVRLGQNVRDAYHQYIGGIVDETDYEEATITLNNSLAELKQATENVTPQYAALKEAVGYVPEKQFNIAYDSSQMMNDIHVDTTEQLQYDRRIEYKFYQTNIDIQHQLTHYYQLAAWPTVSGFFDYNDQFTNNSFSKLYSKGYPYSLIGLNVSIPIFTGFSRIQNLRRSKLEEDYLGWDVINLRARIYSEYTSALAGYKSNLYNLQLQQNNEALAQRVYFVVTLQYKQGIVPYLNVITAESNLISSQINYLNALFQVLSSKVDFQRAMGDIKY